MTTLSIKDVPEDWAEALRQRAARNHRSLQGELTAILEAAVQAGPDAQAAPRGVGPASIAGHARLGLPVERRGRKTIEQIAQEHRRRFPEPIRGGPLAVEIIRDDRDSR
jgi:plasmid stability protein